MPPTKRRPCQTCGKLNMRHVPDCWHCERSAADSSKARNCAICDGAIPRGRSHSQYCGLQCATAVSEARVGVGNRIAQLVKSGSFLPAKTLLCADCGGPAKEYEHREYLKPLDVVPVCRSCNLRRGPAVDVRPFVAKHFGISISEIPVFIARRREEANERRYKLLHPRGNLTARVGAGDTAKEAA